MPELNRWLITNIETGRRESISVDELYVLARALDVSPIHLLTPYDDQEVFVTPVEQHPSQRVRQWVTGQQPLGDSLVVVVETDQWSDLESFLETRYQRILWTAVERARDEDGTVDADALERELADILGGR
jgi:transcriptional regulator with XRE-family HTH domain